MKTILIISIAIILLSCKKDNPIESPAIDIIIDPSIHDQTWSFHYAKANVAMTIKNPSTSTEYLIGKAVVVDSNIIPSGCPSCIGTGHAFWLNGDSTFNLSPGSSKWINVVFDPNYKNFEFIGSLSIYHNSPTRENPIVIKLFGAW